MSEIERYALFGNPVDHSLSPFLHNSFAKLTKQSMHYEKICAPLHGFDDAMQRFIQEGGKGGNITIPFKEACFNIASSLTERAKAAGAVSTFKILDDGKIFGDNCDGFGLIQDLKVNLKLDIHNKSILLIGAGGAARGALKPLLDEKPARLTLSNRTLEKAITLSEQFSAYGKVDVKSFNESVNHKFDIIINATSSGLLHEELPLPDNILAANACCYDMVYSKYPTLFMQWAKKQGAKVIADGLGMLVEQGAQAFFVFRGVRPETGYVYQHLREQLS